MGRCRVAVTVIALLAVTACGAGTVAVPGDATVDWQGHRGARGLRPESTLPGFELALDLGVDTLELDLHYSEDGVVVVWHDPVVEPDKCRGDGVSTPVRRLTAAQLRALRCDGNPDPGRFPDQQALPGSLSGDDFGIVSLAELLVFVDDYAEAESKSSEQRANAEQVRFNIETKRRPRDPATIGDGFDGTAAGPFELAMLAAVDEAGVADRTIVQSFDHRSLWAVGAERPEMTLAALTRVDDRPDLGELVERGAAIWSPDHRALDRDAVAEAGAAGLQVIPWTVNDPADMARLIELGVDGIISDRPDLRPTTP